MDAYTRLIGGINACAIEDYVRGIKMLSRFGKFTSPEAARNFRSAKIWLDSVRPGLTSKLDLHYTNNS